MFRSLTFATVSVAALAASAPAFAQSGVQVGVLDCAGGTNFGFIVGSSAVFGCVFRSNTGRGSLSYAAKVNRVGLDLGFTNYAQMSWLVFAPSQNLGKSAVAGSYGGVSANASVLIGGGTSVLVGGSNNSIALQPVSVQGQTGINVAAAVSNMELYPMGTVPGGSEKKKKSRKKS